MTSAVSLSAWIYPIGAGSNATYGGTIVVKEGEYVIARFPNGTIQWGFANTSPGWQFIDTGYVAPLNQWTHIAVTYDNGTIKTYANGALVHRSEERRVGKECRSWRWAYYEKKKR